MERPAQGVRKLELRAPALPPLGAVGRVPADFRGYRREPGLEDRDGRRNLCQGPSTRRWRKKRDCTRVLPTSTALCKIRMTGRIDFAQIEVGETMLHRGPLDVGFLRLASGGIPTGLLEGMCIPSMEPDRSTIHQLGKSRICAVRLRFGVSYSAGTRCGGATLWRPHGRRKPRWRHLMGESAVPSASPMWRVAESRDMGRLSSRPMGPNRPATNPVSLNPPSKGRWRS